MKTTKMIMTEVLYYYLQHANGMTELVKQDAAYSVRSLAHAGVEVLESGTFSVVLGYIRMAAGF